MTEFQRSDDVRLGRFSAATFQHRQVRYSAVFGNAVFEGDIVLATVQEIEAISRLPEVRRLQPQGVAITGPQYRWPDRTIPYRIHPDLPRPERVEGAIRHWQDHTPIRFLALDSTNLMQHDDRVLFASRNNCWSQLGRRGREQVISLGDSCSMGNAIHEIGHTVGLWHEQSREDRNDFVTVHPENITVGDEHNFDQHVRDGDDLGDYDYGSIMHYPATAFSRNGQPTIVARNGADIGQRTALSAGDIAAVRMLYP